MKLIVRLWISSISLFSKQPETVAENALSEHSTEFSEPRPTFGCGAIIFAPGEKRRTRREKKERYGRAKNVERGGGGEGDEIMI